MSAQPEALRLAELLDAEAIKSFDRYKASAELRRLHEQNAELLATLQQIERGEYAEGEERDMARAAIAKAGGAA